MLSPQRVSRRILIAAAVMFSTHAAWGQSPQLDDFYGFEDLEILRIDPGAGPMTTSDLEGDGLNDLIVVNNRIERTLQQHRHRQMLYTDQLALAVVVCE